MENIKILQKDENGNYIITGADLGDYFYRFDQYTRSKDCEIHKDEIFLQCRETTDNLRYFNPAWFVSNEGRVLSFAQNKPRFLTPVIKPDKPKYRFLRNTYSDKWVKLHRLVALYHNCDSNNVVNFINLEVHHEYTDYQNLSNEEFNSKDNIQLLTRAKHNILTNIEKTGKKGFDKKFEEAKTKCTNYAGAVKITDENWENLLKNYVATHDDAYACLVNEETGEIERIKYLTIDDFNN